MKKKKGFTLIEIIIVIIIIGVLGSIIGPKIFNKPDKARVLKARADITSISSALMEYNQNEGKFPSFSEGLSALVEKPANAKNWPLYGYLYKETLLDPWGNKYLYKIPGNKWYFDVWSFGKDGIDGGEGANATIKSKQ